MATYSIVQKNSGPFSMWQVVKTRNGQVQSTHDNRDDACDAAQRCVDDDRWNASNRD